MGMGWMFLLSLALLMSSMLAGRFRRVCLSLSASCLCFTTFLSFCFPFFFHSHQRRASYGAYTSRG
ncbi:hypothetical protein J3E72DRAFT_285874 [Bipolaris maydis]|uniref:uncharacterized protein n=1 Tax=Cochliobolus heterostrophus TaxID=5016 RepID=UPI0024D88A00|nr:hypothetical protein J3E73DRAFT_264156 [Bipolaris maydis]KAJ5052780.1 hypothetical protein J3E74DRAFT_385624 [Bipolaris maydis]KAJ6201310.1 hypothetical protein J3E72DRAFT_285874 [Bipolaris maydis]KAJ6211683.1 hypothetical protein PSV09DRAFT_2298629 [Bipolaris maydis]KAJ6274040.1 hypothetical protein PSV08DRAFT_279130 [Bipolaris maydis]